MGDILAAEQWITSKLSGDATITGVVGNRIYTHLAPDNTTFPYILISYQTSKDVVWVGANRVLTSINYVIRAITMAGSFSGIGNTAARINTVLHAASGTVAAGVVLGCVRIAPFVMVDPGEGVQYRHLGGIYKLWVQ